MVRLPEHVRDLREVARLAAAGTPGGVAAYEDAVTKWERRIRRLGQGGRAGNYTVRSATQRQRWAVDLRTPLQPPQKPCSALQKASLRVAEVVPGGRGGPCCVENCMTFCT